MIESRNYTYRNPRLFDGEPDEVAGAAALQAMDIIEVLTHALNDVWVLARNSALTDYYKEHGEMPEDADAWWAEQPLAKSLLSSNRYFNEGTKKLDAVSTALTFDPNAPLEDE